MAPTYSRKLLVWTLPFAVLLSYLWFKRKRTSIRSDPGGVNQSDDRNRNGKSLKQELEEAQTLSPPKAFSRSLSGVDTEPIDIILPPERRSQKANALVISDEDLDLEIEKIKSMKNSVEAFNKKKLCSPDTTAEPKSKDKFKNGVTTPNKKSGKNNTSVSKQGKQCKNDINSSRDENKFVCKLTKEEVIANSAIDSLIVVTNLETDKVTKTETSSKMAQKDIVTVASVEEKLSSLKIKSVESCSKVESFATPGASNVENEEIHRQSTERDSANHSPADVMLASPSLSSISDNHSEGSSDSGKGCSDVATPPSRTPAGDGSISGDVTMPAIYEFVIPQNLVGRLIGRHGSFVSQIKDKTRAHILIKKHPESGKLKVCAIEGAQSEIDNALALIRGKFPEKRYPDLTLKQVSFLLPVPTVSLQAEYLSVQLIEGINNDTVLSCMVAPNHLFLQQPTHPTFPNLNVLCNVMNLCYGENEPPRLPNPIPDNTICVAHSLGAWYRVVLLSTDLENDTSYVKFVDYGGYSNVQNSDLRQIRADFLLLPFQAAECILANIRPVGGDETGWAEEAYHLVAELTKGSVLYTQVADYADENLPFVLIYVVLGPHVVCLNDELVNQGFAEWLPPTQQEMEEGAVGGVA